MRTEARQLTQVSGTSTWVSRDERYRIRAGVRSAEVVDARAPSLLALVDRPMAEWRPGDSRTVREVPADICGLPGVRVLRLLVSAGLEYRFGTEVALGDIQADTDGSDDIALRTDSEPDS